jgi:hypothetical protein
MFSEQRASLPIARVSVHRLRCVEFARCALVQLSGLVLNIGVFALNFLARSRIPTSWHAAEASIM